MVTTATGRKRRFDNAAEMRLRRDHEEQGLSVRQLADRHGAHFNSIKKAIQRAGGTVTARPRGRPAPPAEYPGVILSAKSGNAKLGEAASTIVAAGSCPTDCPFYSSGCYAEYDQTGLHWRRVTESGEGLTPLQLARSEAEAIRATPATRDLRLHVAGDSVTREGTRLIADACHEYTARGLRVGKRLTAWGYTHAWRSVLRSDWWAVSMLASCETAADVRSAWRRGYAAAVTVTAFPEGSKAFKLGEGADAVECVPCPAQTSGRTCTECRLCMDDRRLLAERTVIAFEVHGSGAKRAAEAVGRRALPVVTG